MQNVYYIGLVSFFADISSEMVYPLIPLYLAAVFGATPALIGLIEGIAESVASLLKVYSGYITDKYKKKKAVAFSGYATGVIYKIALILATSWGGILTARVIDRIGKGIRTTPRDVMVSESATAGCAGKAFGIHKSMDMAGSAIGILIAFLILNSSDGVYNYKQIFYISIIPAVLSLIMFSKVKEKKEVRVIKPREPFWQNINLLDSRLKLYILVAFLFTLGNSSNVFLLLRAKSLGFEDTTIILLYFIYNVSASLLAIPMGKRSDKVGRKRLLVGGYFVFAAVYFGFAFVQQKEVMVGLFVLYGVYTAMIAGVERAFIAEIAPPQLKGTMLGLHSTVVGIALLPASTVAGILWTVFGAPAPFVFGASLSLLAAMLLLLLMKGSIPSPNNQ
jgi:MFS family permease